MTFLQRIQALMRRLTQGRLKAAPESEERPPEQPGPNLNRWSTCGAHQYRRPGEKVSVVFTNPELDVRKIIVDERGWIFAFPGVSPAAEKHVEAAQLEPWVRFRTDFERLADGDILMRWQVQPDGRYWADDDGFGMENDSEVILCARIDERGNFRGPFELYSIDGKRCCEHPTHTGN